MFRRLGTFWIVSGTIIALGYFLIIAMDFVGQVSFISGIDELVWEIGFLGHLLVILISFLIVIMPLDTYFIVWGTTLQKDPSWIVSGELILFFGLIGAVIGFRSKSVKGAFLDGYIFIILMNLIIFLFLYIPVFGLLVSGIMQGISSRDMIIFHMTSIVENGTTLAVCSTFIATLLDRGVEEKLKFPELCADQSVCPI